MDVRSSNRAKFTDLNFTPRREYYLVIRLTSVGCSGSINKLTDKNQ